MKWLQTHSPKLYFQDVVFAVLSITFLCVLPFLGTDSWGKKKKRRRRYIWLLAAPARWTALVGFTWVICCPWIRDGFSPSEIVGTVLSAGNKQSKFMPSQSFCPSHRLRMQSSLLLIMEISYTWITVPVFFFSLMNFQIQ